MWAKEVLLVSQKADSTRTSINSVVTTAGRSKFNSKCCLLSSSYKETHVALLMGHSDLFHQEGKMITFVFVWHPRSRGHKLTQSDTVSSQNYQTPHLDIKVEWRVTGRLLPHFPVATGKQLISQAELRNTSLGGLTQTPRQQDSNTIYSFVFRRPPLPSF